MFSGDRPRHFDFRDLVLELISVEAAEYSENGHRISSLPPHCGQLSQTAVPTYCVSVRLRRVSVLEPYDCRPTGLPWLAWIGLGQKCKRTQEERNSTKTNRLLEDLTDVTGLPAQGFKESNSSDRRELQGCIGKVLAHSPLHHPQDSRRRDI
jgi:hypothetical protein